MRIAKVLLAAGIIMAAAFAPASAQTIQCPIQLCPELQPCIGTVYTCYFVNGVKVVVVNGQPAPVGSTGQAQFVVVGYTCNPCGVVLAPLNFNSSGQSPVLGQVSTTLSPQTTSTTPVLSTITANTAASSFPATVRIRLPLDAQISSLGNQVFRSLRPVTLVNTNVTSLPFQGLTVNQEGNTEFAGQGGESKFILEGTQVTLNAAN